MCKVSEPTPEVFLTASVAFILSLFSIPQSRRRERLQEAVLYSFIVSAGILCVVLHFWTESRLTSLMFKIMPSSILLGHLMSSMLSVVGLSEAQGQESEVEEDGNKH